MWSAENWHQDIDERHTDFHTLRLRTFVTVAGLTPNRFAKSRPDELDLRIS